MNRSPVGVHGRGRHAPDQCARSLLGELGAQIAHRIARGLRVRRIDQRALNENAAIHNGGRGCGSSGRPVGGDAVLGDRRRTAGRVGGGHAHPVDPGAGEQHVGNRLKLLLTCHHPHGTAGPSREVLAQCDLSLARLRGAQDQIRGGHAVGLELGDAKGSHEQDDGGDHPDHARTLPQQTGDPGPQAGGGTTVIGGNRLGFVERPLRPEGGASEQHQDGRQKRQGGDHGEDDADRGDRPQCAVRLQIGQGQCEQPGDACPAGGHDRLNRALESFPAGLPGVLSHPQLLAVAGDEE